MRGDWTGRKTNGETLEHTNPEVSAGQFFALALPIRIPTQPFHRYPAMLFNSRMADRSGQWGKRASRIPGSRLSKAYDRVSIPGLISR